MSGTPLHYTPTPPGQPDPAEPPFIHHVTVDRGVISVLQRWLPTYLSEMERREGRAIHFLARPAVYTTTYEEDDEDTFSNAKLPTCLVTAGEAMNWERDGDSLWSATYRTAITIVCRGRSMPEARLQASMYAATVTALLLDKPDLEGFAGGIEVINERARPVEDPSNRSRCLTAGMGTYDIWVPGIRRGFSGPFTLPQDPDDVWPQPVPASQVDAVIDGYPPPDPIDEQLGDPEPDPDLDGEKLGVWILRPQHDNVAMHTGDMRSDEDLATASTFWFFPEDVFPGTPAADDMAALLSVEAGMTLQLIYPTNEDPEDATYATFEFEVQSDAQDIDGCITINVTPPVMSGNSSVRHFGEYHVVRAIA